MINIGRAMLYSRHGMKPLCMFLFRDFNFTEGKQISDGGKKEILKIFFLVKDDGTK